MSVFEAFEEPQCGVDAIIVREKDVQPKQHKEYNGAYVIIGFPKCGQISLQNYLVKRFPNKVCERPELVWRRDGVKYYKEHYASRGCIPIMIIREPIDRIWSHFWYGHYAQRGWKLEEYLNFVKEDDNHLGELNPVSESNYGKWIKQWSFCNPIIITLEEMKKNPDFPKDNTTANKRKLGDEMPFMCGEDRRICEKYIKRECEEQKLPSWSKDYWKKGL